MTTTALVGLGSNLGASLDVIDAALAALALLSTRPLRVSSLWRSEPVDCPPGSPDFVNAVVALEVAPDLTPEALLDALLDIERDLGRERVASVRNAPRILDLDLLLMGDEVRDGERLQLPHPRGHERGFVLVPAAEVAPDLIWPGTGRTVAELRAELVAGLGVVAGMAVIER